MSEVLHLPLNALREHWSPGSHGGDWTWGDEMSDLWLREPFQMMDLVRSVEAEGVREPVLLGTDGRVWDGHHRIVTAVALGLKSIPAVLSLSPDIWRGWPARFNILRLW